MLDTKKYIEDADLAGALLDNAQSNGGRLSPEDIVFGLKNILKLKYYPVAVKFFYSSREISETLDGVDYKTGLRPFTFCHYLAASRQRGDILFGGPEKIGCSNASYVLGWKELNEREVDKHLKYTKDRAQAKRFLLTKTRMESGLLGFASAPLHLAPYEPDVIHGICDPLQAYYLANDWCAAFDIHPFEMWMTMNSSVCHGCVHAYRSGKPNITLMCSGSRTAGKTEQGEVNYIFPGRQLETSFHWTLERIVRDGSAAYSRQAEPFPGPDICKLCPFLVFTSPKK